MGKLRGMEKQDDQESGTSWDNWNEGLVLEKGIKYGIVAETWK